MYRGKNKEPRLNNYNARLDDLLKSQPVKPCSLRKEKIIFIDDDSIEQFVDDLYLRKVHEFLDKT